MFNLYKKAKKKISFQRTLCKLITENYKRPNERYSCCGKKESGISKEFEN